MITFWRTFYHDGKISLPGEVHALPHFHSFYHHEQSCADTLLYVFCVQNQGSAFNAAACTVYYKTFEHLFKIFTYVVELAKPLSVLASLQITRCPQQILKRRNLYFLQIHQSATRKIIVL
jgi:hypothetical protein